MAARTKPRSLVVVAVLLALLNVFGVAEGQAPQFKVLAIVPSVQATNDQPYGLDAQQDLTVLFSRSVIALGSDFDNSTFTTGELLLI
jgi:hypothetical protein